VNRSRLEVDAALSHFDQLHINGAAAELGPDT
jgi:hypothetical protein